MKPAVESFIGRPVINFTYLDAKNDISNLLIGQFTIFTPFVYLDHIAKSYPSSLQEEYSLIKSSGL